MKNNKIKPIKKIMIFTIITVMIVSLFAVPAFADDSQVTDLVGTTWILGDIAFGDVASGAGIFKIDGSGTMTVNISGETQQLIGTSDEIYVGYFAIPPDVNPYQGFVAVRGVFGGQTGVANLGTVNGDPVTIIHYQFTITGGEDISDPLFIDFINTYGTLVTDEPDGEELGIFAVWTQITQWIVQGLGSVSNAFYTNGELTLLGYLCIIPLAIGVAFLLIAIIQKFLRLRG